MTSLLAEFTADDQLIAAARRLRELGYAGMEAYSPFALPDLDAILARKPSRIPACVFVGAVVGAVLGYGIQWATIIDFPLRVASMPSIPVPALIPITFETMILGGALTAFICAFVGCGMLQWWHPYDEIDGFERASIDRFFLAVPVAEGTALDTCRHVLEEQHPLRVVTVAGGP